ncbi:hypothetical protein MKX08_001388 [Trichoderma sp. CBMAI-0020]|nr:hypothetical protein MKX08_001388 [Trichoderma sp. CBMAI-0020]
MDQEDSNTRDISNNHFGNNVTINQGDVHNYASDQDNQCLRDLRSTDPRHDKRRIQNTKGGLLRDSYRWVLENEKFKDWRDNAQNRILWIKGDPGKGKTMLLCGIIDELMPMTKLAKPIDPTTNTILLSYFFCQGTNARINNATAVLRGLIYLLVVQEPSLISHVRTKYEHAGKDLFSDANAWEALSEILMAILQDSQAKEVILVIDALDECEADLPKLLDTIVQQLAPLHVKCIISSRNILGIQQRLESYIPQGVLSLELKGNASCVSEAVDAYIKHSISRLTSIQDDHGLQEDLRTLIQQKANGTFLWVSLVIKELEEAQSWEIMEVVEEMPTDLTALYERMIKNIRCLKRGNDERCRNILSAIFTAYYPLRLAEVGVLAGLPDQISKDLKSITKLVTMCGSFLTLNQDKVYFIHQSAKDFLTAGIFFMNAAQRHADIFKRSIAAISKLSKNIYNLTDFGPRPEDAQPPNPNPLASMRYSCFYWANHLCDAYSMNNKDEAQAIISETLKPFLNSYVLRWIESLALLNGLLEGLRSIRKLLHELPRSENTQLSSILSSIEIFMLRNGVLIAKSPLQVYGSALIFSPVHGHIKATQWNERLPFIKDIQGVKEDGFLQTLKGHTKDINALAFSSNSETLVSMSYYDDTLRCWDVATGALKWSIECRRGLGAAAIAFSPDNGMLLLATHGKPMLVGYTEEREEGEAENDDYWITYFPLSPTSGMPETSRVIRTVRLNGPFPMDKSYDYVTAFAFSSDDQNKRISDYGPPEYFAFFPDGSRLASSHSRRRGESICEIFLWYTATGLHWKTVKVDMPDKQVYASLVFSPNGRYLCIGHQYMVRLPQEDEDEDEDEDEYEEILSLDADLFEGMQSQLISVTGGWVTKDRNVCFGFLENIDVGSKVRSYVAILLCLGTILG